MSTLRAMKPVSMARRIEPGNSGGKIRGFVRSGGFTLIELLIVMTVLGILASIAVPSYKRNVIKAREAVLLEDLYQMRKAIDAFYADTGAYPDSLDALVEKKYLRDIPRDPFTRERDWECVPPDIPLDGSPAVGGCYDVKSNSDLLSLNNEPYSEW